MTSKITHPSMRSGNQATQTKTGNKPEVFVVENLDNTTSIDDQLKQFEQSSVNYSALMEMPKQVQPQVQSPPINMPPQQIVPPPTPIPVVSTKQEPISKELKTRAESFLFFGKVTRDIEIAGHTYTISSLSSKEQTEILKALYSVADSADLFTVRSYTLANVLKSVDGLSLDSANVFDEESEPLFKSKFERRVAIIENMQLAVVEKIYDQYNELLSESEKVVSENTIKK